MTLVNWSYFWLVAESLFEFEKDCSHTVAVWPQANHLASLNLSVFMYKIKIWSKGLKDPFWLECSGSWLPESGSSFLLPPVYTPRFVSSPKAKPPLPRSGRSWQWEREWGLQACAGVGCGMHICSWGFFWGFFGLIWDLLNASNSPNKSSLSSVASEPLAGIWLEKVTFLCAAGTCQQIL